MSILLLVPSFQEIIFIIIVVIILFGSKNLPDIVKTFAKSIRQIKDLSNNVKKEIHKSIDDIE
ncbi:MAG: twin-arginine translocase TatA/TatE family subunit [Flavobacteriales bacterium]|nr:twin-arginine translocase TatA/TatE family subunit [Flavobacteriales bacterium]